VREKGERGWEKDAQSRKRNHSCMFSEEYNGMCSILQILRNIQIETRYEKTDHCDK